MSRTAFRRSGMCEKLAAYWLVTIRGSTECSNRARRSRVPAIVRAGAAAGTGIGVGLRDHREGPEVPGRTIGRAVSRVMERRRRRVPAGERRVIAHIDPSATGVRLALAAGRVSQPALVCWEGRSHSLIGARPTASFNSGLKRSASQSSATSYSQTIANMRKRSIAGSVRNTSDGSRHCRMQPESVSARESRRHAAGSKTNTASLEIRPSSKSPVTFFHCEAGRSNGRRVPSLLVGLALSFRASNSLDHGFPPSVNNLGD